MKEKTLQNSVVAYLESLGAYVISVKSGKLMAVYSGKVRMIHLAPAGTPDLFVILEGIPICIELKKDEKTADQWKRVVSRYRESGSTAKSNIPIIQQYECHNEITRAGGIAIVCGSVQEVEDELVSHGFIQRTLPKRVKYPVR